MGLRYIIAARLHLLHRCRCPWDADSPPDSAFIGRYGEWVAASYLRAHGVRVLRCNVHLGGAELDMVCRHGETLAVCEVKSTAAPRHGAPARKVDAHKRMMLRRGMDCWLSMLHRQPPTRFDVVEVYMEGRKRPEVLWSQAAFGRKEGPAQ